MIKVTSMDDRICPICFEPCLTSLSIISVSEQQQQKIEWVKNKYNGSKSV